jgi:hypothetical protein
LFTEFTAELPCEQTSLLQPATNGAMASAITESMRSGFMASVLLFLCGWRGIEAA